MAPAADESNPDIDDDSGKAGSRSAGHSGARHHSVTRFKSVVLDVDSTLSGVEGIDWLASLRGAEVEAWSSALTAQAMEGVIPIETVYGERMGVVKPTLSEIQELSAVYIDRAASGAREALAKLREHD